VCFQELSNMIVIIDYGMGNLGSILNMFKKTGAKALISSDLNDIKDADKLVLPGVGAFDTGMKKLDNLGIVSILNEKVIKERTPIIGICLGMQMMTMRSEEGEMAGLGWVDAETVKFVYDKERQHMKIPHMGWNYINIKQAHPLLDGMSSTTRFYFVHSYYVACNRNDNILASTIYSHEFTSIIIKDNIIGVQFHPEKSNKYGMQLLKNFDNMN